MNICDDGHDEVCYDGGNCPCCDLMYENGEIESERDDLQDQVESLENTISDLEYEIEQSDESELVKSLRDKIESLNKIIVTQNARM